jgi:hypothetical protein
MNLYESIKQFIGDVKRNPLGSIAVLVIVVCAPLVLRVAGMVVDYGFSEWKSARERQERLDQEAALSFDAINAYVAAPIEAQDPFRESDQKLVFTFDTDQSKPNCALAIVNGYSHPITIRVVISGKGAANFDIRDGDTRNNLVCTIEASSTRLVRITALGPLDSPVATLAYGLEAALDEHGTIKEGWSGRTGAYNAGVKLTTRRKP